MNDNRNSPGQRAQAQSSAVVSPFLGQRVMLIAAHPDDEVLFAGAQLCKAEALLIIHVTDGAPSRLAARRLGFETRGAYAATRLQESRRARAAGAVRARSVCLNLRDGRSYLRIASGARRIAALIGEFRPQILLTHAYDGGHIDHDTAAAMTHIARRLSRSRAKIWEMAGYFSDHRQRRTYEFATESPHVVFTYRLSECERAMKRRMLSEFVSQRGIVAQFSLDAEVFREAPRYNFKFRPLGGPLAYETSDSGLEGLLWRRLVRHDEAAVLGCRVASGVRDKAAAYLVARCSRFRTEHPRVDALLVRVLGLH